MIHLTKKGSYKWHSSVMKDLWQSFCIIVVVKPTNDVVKIVIIGLFWTHVSLIWLSFSMNKISKTYVLRHK